MEFNIFNIPPVLFGLQEKNRNWKERLTVVMSYVMFPAVLHINKYVSRFTSFLKFLSFFTFQFFVNAIYQYTIVGGPALERTPQFEKPCSKFRQILTANNLCIYFTSKL